MALTQAKVTCGLQARATAANEQSTSPATVGSTSTKSHPAADVVFASRITAAAANNVATLVVATGTIAQTTGSPTILRSAKDFEGNLLATSAKIHGIRLRTAAANTGTVTIGGVNSGLFPAITLGAGRDLVLDFPAAGVALAGSETITFTFSSNADIADVEFLGEE